MEGGVMMHYRGRADVGPRSKKHRRRVRCSKRSTGQMARRSGKWRTAERAFLVDSPD
jgi:hypothetical protein